MLDHNNARVGHHWQEILRTRIRPRPAVIHLNADDLGNRHRNWTFGLPRGRPQQA
jgi:hypothetical protein